MHPLLDALGGAHRHAEQLDPVAELLGGFEILRRDRGNAFDEHRIGIDAGAVGDAGEDRELLGGVEALHVEARIGLGIAEALGVLEALGKRQPLLLHARQDVIAGAVEDAVDAGKGIAGEALAQRLDDRDRAADGGFEIERRPVRLGEIGERGAVPGEQRLVRGHHRLAGGERGFHRALGGIAVAAHQFDEHVDAGVGRERDGIADEARRRGAEVPLLGGVARAHRDHLDRAAAAQRQHVAMLLQQPHHGGTDRAEPGKTRFQGRDHGPSASANCAAAQRRFARGTTLCNFSGPVSRNRRRLRAA